MEIVIGYYTKAVVYPTNPTLHIRNDKGLPLCGYKVRSGSKFIESAVVEPTCENCRLLLSSL
jgi:hypothetical protein